MNEDEINARVDDLIAAAAGQSGDSVTALDPKSPSNSVKESESNSTTAVVDALKPLVRGGKVVVGGDEQVSNSKDIKESSRVNNGVPENLDAMGNPIITIDSGVSMSESNSQVGYLNRTQALESALGNIADGLVEEHLPQVAPILQGLGITAGDLAGMLVRKFNKRNGSDSASPETIQEEMKDTIIDLVAVAEGGQRIFRENIIETEGKTSLEGLDDLRQATAIVRRAVSALPAGLQDLMFIRMALALNNDTFEMVCRESFDDSFELALARVPDMADRYRLR